MIVFWLSISEKFLLWQKKYVLDLNFIFWGIWPRNSTMLFMIWITDHVVFVASSHGVLEKFNIKSSCHVKKCGIKYSAYVVELSVNYMRSGAFFILLFIHLFFFFLLLNEWIKKLKICFCMWKLMWYWKSSGDVRFDEILENYK